LINTFVIRGPVILGVDDTIERRRGTKIKAKGTYRDPVRSSHNHFVKASGLRWLSLMLLAPIPWVQRVWALPFLSVVAPCERYYQGKTRRHKKLTEGAQLPIRWVIVRDPKKIFKTQALLCRDINISAEQIIHSPYAVLSKLGV
jgi:DDE superfamily endonuclease